MKKLLMTLVVLVTSSVLFACGEKAEFKRIKKYFPTTELATSTTSQEVTEKDKLDKLKKQYATVFEDYQKIADEAENYQQGDDIDFYHLSDQLHSPIHMASIENTLISLRDLVYAFYDLDQNGQFEMLVGSNQKDGSVYPKGFYYLKNGTPTLLAESYIGSASARGSHTIFTDGTILSVSWSPGMGDAEGTLYQLQEDSSEAVVIEERDDFKIPGSALAPLLGKTDEMILNLESLDWQRFELEQRSQDEAVSYQVFPEEMLGSWQGISSDFGKVNVEVFQDGRVISDIERSSSRETILVESIEEVGFNTYRHKLSSPNGNRPLVSVFQLGGAGIKYDFGFKLEDETLTILIWSVALNDDFDYTNPLEMNLPNFKFKLASL